MPFDIALSGIRAASSELEITGNNIANASTAGFKASRAEFGDVYATSVLGAGSNQVGAGVEIQEITQRFTQGNITFTENALDLAVNGNGFFILNDTEGGGRTYTRSGAFGLDSDGFVTANNGSRLQGYSADTAGNIDNVIGDLQIRSSTIDPRQTTAVEQALNLDATAEVLPSNGRQFTTQGAEVGVAQLGTTNGYSAQSLDITDLDGNTVTYTSPVNASAAEIATDLNAVLGLTATAQTEITLLNLNGLASPLDVRVNNITLSANTLAELETSINALSNSSLPGVTAALDTATGQLVVRSAVGSNLSFNITGDAGATLDVLDVSGATQNLVVGGADTATVGGSLNIVVEDGFVVSNEVPSGPALFQALGDITDPTNTVFSEVEVNTFDPDDPNTYNSATSTTVYDSFGVQHVMTQYFVKQPFTPSDPTSSTNHWVMHVLVGGQDVGNPDPTSADPSQPTRASFNIFFNANGSLDELRTNNFLITNWEPGTGALGSNVGGTLPLPEPPISSNFSIEVTGSTQFGTPFAVNSIDQNGFTAGQLSGLNVADSGIIFARFTNGESLTLGQVLMADFSNQQGLQPIGDTAWAQTFESGDPIINEPGTASLGAVQSGALEESNVDLSEQLVQLIISQRNFQASAKTIETADQTTQTIINLR